MASASFRRLRRRRSLDAGHRLTGQPGQRARDSQILFREGSLPLRVREDQQAHRPVGRRHGDGEAALLPPGVQIGADGRISLGSERRSSWERPDPRTVWPIGSSARGRGSSDRSRPLGVLSHRARMTMASSSRSCLYATHSETPSASPAQRVTTASASSRLAAPATARLTRPARPACARLLPAPAGCPRRAAPGRRTGRPRRRTRPARARSCGLRGSRDSTRPTTSPLGDERHDEHRLLVPLLHVLTLRRAEARIGGDRQPPANHPPRPPPLRRRCVVSVARPRSLAPKRRLGTHFPEAPLRRPCATVGKRLPSRAQLQETAVDPLAIRYAVWQHNHSRDLEPCHLPDRPLLIATPWPISCVSSLTWASLSACRSRSFNSRKLAKPIQRSAVRAG